MTIATARKLVEAFIIKYVERIAPGIGNKEIYQDFFSTMNDEDFDSYMTKLEKGEIKLPIFIPNSKAKVVNENEKLEGNQKFTTLQNLSSEVNYNNIYDNIDLQCFISSTGVKENIILENAKANNEFQIQYDIQDLMIKL